MPGKNQAQTYTEILNSTTEDKQRSLTTQGPSHYKEKGDMIKDDALRKMLTANTEELAEVLTSEKISLEDDQEVQKRMIGYLRGCAETATFPTFMGFARALGYSRRALTYWREHKPESNTAKIIEMFSDYSADVLNQSALKNNANSIVAIFLSKALYGFKETSEIEISPASSTEDIVDVEEIKRRYLVDEEE